MSGIQEFGIERGSLTAVSAHTPGRRAENKNPPTEARRLIVAAASVLPVARPQWLVKPSHSPKDSDKR